MGENSLREFRDRFQLPITDEQLSEVPFLRFGDDSPELKYLRERRSALGGSMPARRAKSDGLEVPPLSAFEALLKATEGRQISTTMAFVRILNTLLRDKAIGKRVVPIVPDESCTFGMEGMFRQFGIFSQVGQLYRPEDANQLDVLQRGQERTTPARGHKRARRHVVLDRSSDLVFDLEHADDPLLHLLLDVRLPTHW